MSDILAIIIALESKGFFSFSSLLACIHFHFCSSYSSNRITEAFLGWIWFHHRDLQKRSFVPITCARTSAISLKTKEKINIQYLQSKIDQPPKDYARGLEAPVSQNRFISIVLETLPVSSQDYGHTTLFGKLIKQMHVVYSVILILHSA